MDVQAERLTWEPDQSKHSQTCAIQGPHSLGKGQKDQCDCGRDELVALLAGQAEQIDQLTKELDEALRQRQVVFERKQAAVRQRDNLRDALREILELPNALTTRSVQVRAKQALRAAAVDEGTDA